MLELRMRKISLAAAVAVLAACSPSPQESWWSAVSEQCGKAFAGVVVSEDMADAPLAERPLVMHVRRCDDTKLEIPFHIGEDRSRTWVLTRTEAGIQLQHDHRREDGSPDPMTLYGGHTTTEGTAVAQEFPADDYSKELFVVAGFEESVANVWSMEIVPGETFAYVLRRPRRHFRAEFDLTEPVEPPPPPWGHE